jgi:transposase
MHSKGAPRRRHSEELKTLVLAACAEPGASVAAVAQAHGLNANLVHKWRQGAAGASQRSMTAAKLGCAADQRPTVFVPLALPAQPPMATTPDIRIELRRGATSIAVTWPTAAAAQCAAWMRELLR